MKIKLFLLTLTALVAMATNTQAQKSKPKVLVAYFSWSGNTRTVANQISEFMGGDMFEIKPQTPYSSNYRECVDFAKVEKQQNARPAIVGKVDNIGQYDIIFVGYPNWWATLPMPVFTFMESYDFKGKILIPFVTHGGGGAQQCFTDFTKLTSKYETKKGLLLNGSSVGSAKPQVQKWLKEEIKVLM